MSALRDQLVERVIGAGRVAGLTEAEVGSVLSPLAVTTALTVVDAQRGGSLLLLGEVGTGKTLAAIRWLMRSVIRIDGWRHAGSWLPVVTPSMLFRTARSLALVRQYDASQLEPLFSVRRLVLDDLGQEYLDKSGFLVSLIDHVVTERHRRGLPILVTANMSVDVFEERYSLRVLDRIAGSGKVVACKGTSLRGGKPKLTVPAPLSEADVASRFEACRKEDLRRVRAENAAAARTPRPPDPPPRAVHESHHMTDDELAARKTQIADQLRAWQERNSA